MIAIKLSNKYELVARWIREESNDSIKEIEFLLKNSYDKVEELEEAYGDVIKHKESEVKNESEV